MLRGLVLAVTAIALTDPVFAWEATVEGPDVFGKTKVVALEGGLRNSLIVQCDSAGEVILAYIEKKKEFDEVAEIPVKLFLKTSNEGPQVLEAKLRNWNDNYSGVVVDKSNTGIVAAIQSIGEAKKKIEIGVEVLGQQFSASFSSQGSRKAIEKVMKECKLSAPATQQTP